MMRHTRSKEAKAADGRQKVASAPMRRWSTAPPGALERESSGCFCYAASPVGRATRCARGALCTARLRLGARRAASFSDVVAKSGRIVKDEFLAQK